MKKLAIIFALLLGVLVFLVQNLSAFSLPRQIITGKFEAYTLMMPGDLIAQVSIVGSADISPSGSLETLNNILQGDKDTINAAFISFTESLNCTVGNAVSTDDPMFMDRTAIYFVCQGTHRDVLNMTANLLSFPLTFVANTEP